MASHETIPSSICLRITRHCNAACAFCQAPPTSREELSVADIGALSAVVGARSVRTVKLSGGEPTVRRDLPDIIRAVVSGGPIPVVVTNGIRLDDETLDACAAAGGEFKFSVHRPSRLNDDVLRRRSFDDVGANMGRVRDRGIRLSVNTVVTRSSVAVMDDMVDFARSAGAAKISFIPVVERGRARSGNGPGNGQYALRLSELAGVRDRVARLAATHQGRPEVRLIDFRHHGYWLVENDGSLWIEFGTEEADTQVCGPGGALGHLRGLGKGRISGTDRRAS